MRGSSFHCVLRVAAVVGLVATLVPACTSGTTSEVLPSDKTIGYYCDQIVPVMCTYAVGTCHQSGTVDECVTASRNACCQQACNRPARPSCTTVPCDPTEEAAIIDACEVAYAGDPTTGTAGLACASVLAGFAPDACVNKFRLLD